MVLREMYIFNFEAMNKFFILTCDNMVQDMATSVSRLMNMLGHTNRSKLPDELSKILSFLTKSRYQVNHF